MAQATLDGDLMHAADCLVEVRDRTLARIGSLPGVASWQITEPHLGLGTWQVQLPVEHPMSGPLQEPGSGIVVTGPDGEFYSGPMTKFEFSATTTERGLIKIEGVTDSVILSDRLAFPDPATADPLNQKKDFDQRTGVAETLMHQLVNANIGPAAPSARRVPSLILGANGARGMTTSVRARFEKLGELLTELATVAGLGFRVLQRGSALVFETYMPADLRAERRWSLGTNDLAGARVAIAAPILTRPIVGGEGGGIERVFAAPTRPWALEAEAQWARRIETFIDQASSASTAEAEQTGVAALESDGQTQVIAEAVPMDDTPLGITYPPGSQVAVDIGGVELGTTLSGYTIAADAEGLRVGAMLGDVTGLDADRWLHRQAQSAGRRISRLERVRELASHTQQRHQFTGVPGWFKLAEMPAPAGDTTAYAQAVMTVRMSNGSAVTTARVRIAGAAATRSTDSFELIECSSNTTFPDGNGSILNEFEFAVNSAGTILLWAYIPSGRAGANLDVMVQVEPEFSLRGAQWRPAIGAATGGVIYHSIGVHPTGSEFRPLNVAAASGGIWASVSTDPVGYLFRPGPLVELRGKVTGGYSTSTSTYSTLASVPPGCRGLAGTKFATNEATGGVIHLDTGGSGLLRLRTTGLVTVSLDGISYRPQF
jgi:hypothetical protein